MVDPWQAFSPTVEHSWLHLQTPLTQVARELQLPQVPPQPSGPHLRPAHWRWQTHLPPLQAWPDWQWQSVEQVEQFSPPPESQVPSPQGFRQLPPIHFCPDEHLQSEGQVVQFSPAAASQVPSPQGFWQAPLTQRCPVGQGQSAGQVEQFSPRDA